MLKFLKKFDFSFFLLQGELAFGLALSKWMLSIELFNLHLSVEFLTDEQRRNQERTRKYIKELLEEDWA